MKTGARPPPMVGAAIGGARESGSRGRRRRSPPPRIARRTWVGPRRRDPGRRAPPRGDERRQGAELRYDRGKDRGAGWGDPLTGQSSAYIGDAFQRWAVAARARDRSVLAEDRSAPTLRGVQRISRGRGRREAHAARRCRRSRRARRPRADGPWQTGRRGPMPPPAQTPEDLDRETLQDDESVDRRITPAISEAPLFHVPPVIRTSILVAARELETTPAPAQLEASTRQRAMAARSPHSRPDSTSAPRSCRRAPRKRRRRNASSPPHRSKRTAAMQDAGPGSVCSAAGGAAQLTATHRAKPTPPRRQSTQSEP